jgi:hypothetical protein
MLGGRILMTQKQVYLRRRLFFTLMATAILVLVGLGGGAAFAFFKATGSGSGQAKVANGDSNITFSTASVGGATALYPGGTGDLVATVTNPNASTVTVAAMTITSSTCTTPAITLNHSFTIPANLTSATVETFPGVLSMGTNASNDCQGKTLTLTLSAVTVQQ